MSRASIPEGDIRKLHKLHTAGGFSVNKLGTLLHAQYGYTNPKACALAIWRGFKRTGLPPVRQVAATQRANRRHGRASHLNKDEYRKYNREWSRKRNNSRKCRGHVTTHRARRLRGNGAPCSKWANHDSDFCTNHDPRYTEMWRELGRIGQQRRKKTK